MSEKTKHSNPEEASTTFTLEGQVNVRGEKTPNIISGSIYFPEDFVTE